MSSTLTHILSAEKFDICVRYVDLVAVPSEDGDGWSVSAPTLPGVWSQGRDLEEAFRHGEEALRAVIESYRDNGDRVPWLNDHFVVPDQRHRAKTVEVR